MKHIFPFSISVLLLVFCVDSLSAQNDSIQVDSVAYKQSYGLRLGGDLGKLIRTAFEDDYTGFEIMGDFRLTDKLYIAGEIGTETKGTNSENLMVETSGSYFKAGIDYNFYQNWLDMDNMIYGGLRVGISSFKHDLIEYTIYNTDQYYQSPLTITDSQEFSGLAAIWAEFLVGIKAQILNNLYMGVNIQFKGLVSEDEPTNFENLYVPGYNRTYDSGRFGFGYGYFLAYRIPLYKKSK